jgi:hypothetical protein
MPDARREMIIREMATSLVQSGQFLEETISADAVEEIWNSYNGRAVAPDASYAYYNGTTTSHYTTTDAWATTARYSPNMIWTDSLGESD